MLEEPVLGHEFDAQLGEESADPRVAECIQRLVEAEPFGVLCTQGGGQPYGSVVAFAFSQDLKTFVFATSVATRKYRLLSGCDRVALVIDNRGRFPDDLMKVSAVTVTGRARQLDPVPEHEQWSGLLTERHPYLQSFVDAASTALFRVDVVRFLHVTRFQEVRQWIPAIDG